MATAGIHRIPGDGCVPRRFRAYRVLLVFTVVGLAFSLYLATIEKNVLGVWCIYCVISLGIIGAMCIVDLGAVTAGSDAETESGVAA